MSALKEYLFHHKESCIFQEPFSGLNDCSCGLAKARKEYDKIVTDLAALRFRITELEQENLELRKPVVILGEKLRQPPEE